MKEQSIRKAPTKPFHWGILPKLLLSFLLLTTIPLIILGYIATKNLLDIGAEGGRRAEEMGAENLESARRIGNSAIADSVRALDEKATEAIELRTGDLAQKVADFLYERDKDLLLLTSLPPDPRRYLEAYAFCHREVIVPRPWPRDPAEKPQAKVPPVTWRNPENKESWRHRPPDNFIKKSIPLYREFTFVDLKGMEKIKIADGKISDQLVDVSKRENTFCQAEDYFSHLGRLRPGEIYVSRVIGPYVKGWLYQTPEGVKVKPGSAYAGKENFLGQKFEGIIRWATPVYGAQGKKLGYVTMALDHTHIMEFTDHVVPTEERFSDISDAGSGNYAFIWDYQDKCISHPRDFFICGYDPATGEEVPGWVSEDTYREFEKSGYQSLNEFVKQLPPFRNFSLKKPGSTAQMLAGCVSLDGRILDTAPQCEDWHTGTEDGGSGSFVIFWSGLWKLTTYAAIPYYTGMYGESKRGFGYVTIGANVEEFHKAANLTRAEIQKSIAAQGQDIEVATGETRNLINRSLAHNRRLMTIITLLSALAVISASAIISWNITNPLRRLTEGALAISRGEMQQSIEVKAKDEIGQLAKSFNEMAAAVAEVDRMKSEFVTIASHELRTPIQAMLLSISGILAGYSGQIDQEVRDDLQLAKYGIERLMRMVENLLDLSRMEARKFELNLAETRVADLVQRALEEVSDLLLAHHHEVITRLPEDLPSLTVDKDRLIQVLLNLLSNSIKYTPDGGKILISAATRGDEMIIAVADNGYGIPDWAQEEVFDKFFQADSIMSQKVGGSGLGLTISQGIIAQHGGRISCESPISPEQFPELPLRAERPGTVFLVHLPFRKLTQA